MPLSNCQKFQGWGHLAKGRWGWERWMHHATFQRSGLCNSVSEPLPWLPHNLSRERKLSFLLATKKKQENLIIRLLQDSQSFNYWKSGETHSNLISLEKSDCLYWQNLHYWWEISHSDFKSCSLAAWFIKLMGHFLLNPPRIRSVRW